MTSSHLHNDEEEEMAVAGDEEEPKKHPCPDCRFCQWCSDDRCRICRGERRCARKLSTAEQIELFERLNSAKSNMPLQNRVKPDGEIVASTSRGTLMGNRGNLHNERKELVRQTTHYLGWVACLLQYKGVHRELMTPREYTELFFLDEATAFSAGHRPCGYCQRERFKAFKAAWLRANASVHPLVTTNIKDVDVILQKERIDGKGRKVTYGAEAIELPDGAFVLKGEKYFLKWKDQLLEWSFDGYVSVVPVSRGEVVDVLTPRSIVRCFEHGFSPKVHESGLLLFRQPDFAGLPIR